MSLSFFLPPTVTGAPLGVLGGEARPFAKSISPCKVQAASLDLGVLCHVMLCSAGMAVFDTMRHIRPDVSTVCVGLAASMGAFLLASGHQVSHLTGLSL